MPNNVESTTVFDGLVFEVRRDKVTLPNGLETSRDVVQHPGAVVILPVKEDKKTLVIVKQYRHAVGESIFEFPAGTLEKGEKPLECAKREIIEEASLASNKMTELGILYPAPGFCNEKQYLFLAEELSFAEAPGDEDEIIEVCEVAKDEFETMITQGQIIDAKSIAIYTRAKLMGLLDV